MRLLASKERGDFVEWQADTFGIALELYGQPSSHAHLQYQHDNQSVSPQQSSTSDADETTTRLVRASCAYPFYDILPLEQHAIDRENSQAQEAAEEETQRPQ